MKVIFSILLILILVTSLNFTLDEGAMKLHEEAFERAMVAFGLAKGLNGVISLIQGTELSFAPVGIGLNFSVGEVLDPFNDMVERFSWIMLLASVSLGIQKLLLVLSSNIFLNVALVISGSITMIFMWKKRVLNSYYISLFIKIFLFLLILRFAAIAFVYTSDLLYNEVLETQYKSSSSVLEKTKGDLEHIQNENKKVLDGKKESRWYELDMHTKYEEIKSQLNISEKLDSLSNTIEVASRNIISLVTLFVVQTVIMPLLFLWMFVYMLKLTFRIDLENRYINSPNH